MSSFLIKKATLADIPFLSKAILEAEKSFSQRPFLAKLFSLSDELCVKYIAEMLEEEMEGCEFSISSFLIAFDRDKPIASVGGWIENFDGTTESNKIRASLIGYVFPKEAILAAKESAALISQFSLVRRQNFLQIEYVYVQDDYRGRGIAAHLIEAHIKEALVQFPSMEGVEIQFFDTNEIAAKVYEKIGFVPVDRVMMDNEQAQKLMPGNIKIKALKKIDK